MNRLYRHATRFGTLLAFPGLAWRTALGGDARGSQHFDRAKRHGSFASALTEPACMWPTGGAEA